MATPRARSSTILPAPVGPTQGSRLLPPVEPASPSPMSRTPSGLARECSTTRHRGAVSRTPLPLRNPSHSFNTTASGAGMCFFRFLGCSRNWPTLRPSSPCRTHRSTGASYPHSICLLFFPPHRWWLQAPRCLLYLQFVFGYCFPPTPVFWQG